jgi:hypothetical protein
VNFDGLWLQLFRLKARLKKEKVVFAAGTRVRVTKLDDTRGMRIAGKFLVTRKEGAVGTVYGCVGGHGGDVLWVKHEDGAEAAYCYTELEEWPEGSMGIEVEGTERFEGVG